MKAPENNNKKGGFLAALSRIFGGSAASGGAASGGIGSAASGGGIFSSLGGLFASKAGIVGMVLGGATIAAGVGVVYNFVGPSSKPVYSPSLFENQYYESEVESASAQRIADANSSSNATGSSSLDYFRDQAKRDGMGFGDGDGVEGEVGDASADGADNLASGSADGAASGDGNDGGANASANMPRLQKAPSFGTGGGGTQSKLTLGGSGMSGGIGSKFQKFIRHLRENFSSMKGSVASKINKAGKHSLSNFNKKGAYGQAKYSGKLGKKAAYASSDVGAKTTALESFDGGVTGEGDIETPDMGGAGLGGTGVSDGDGLKGSDPSLNSSSYTPPTVPDPEIDDPTKKYTDMALYGMLAAAVLIGITNMLVKAAKASLIPATAAAYYTAAKITAGLAMAASAIVTFAGIMLMRGDPSGDPPWEGQKWMGGMYAIMGAYMLYKSYEALTGAMEGGDVAATQKEGLATAENGNIKTTEMNQHSLTDAHIDAHNKANPTSQLKIIDDVPKTPPVK